MTKTVFLKSGDSFIPTAEAALDLHPLLPAGNYVVRANPNTGALYFDKIDSFPKVGKTYGDTTRHADRFMNTFMERPGSTGILLTGEKGSGKTLLAKVLAHKGAEQGMPTIIINEPWRGDKFNQLIQGLSQPAIVMFDEFEKVYDSDQQEEILTLLDGVFPSKKLFVLTCNNKWRIDQHLRNRPGRIFYLIDFKGLSSEFITQYCDDNLNAKEHIATICKIAMLFDQFNFDMLKALVEDMNRYQEDPHTVMELLNAKPSGDDGGQYTVTLTLSGESKTVKQVYPEKYSGSPIGKDTITITAYGVNTDTAEAVDEDDHDQEIYFLSNDLKTIDVDTGTFTFLNANGDRLVLKRVVTTAFNYRDAF